MQNNCKNLCKAPQIIFTDKSTRTLPKKPENLIKHKNLLIFSSSTLKGKNVSYCRHSFVVLLCHMMINSPCLCPFLFLPVFPAFPCMFSIRKTSFCALYIENLSRLFEIFHSTFSLPFIFSHKATKKFDDLI